MNFEQTNARLERLIRVDPLGKLGHPQRSGEPPAHEGRFMSIPRVEHEISSPSRGRAEEAAGLHIRRAQQHSRPAPGGSRHRGSGPPTWGDTKPETSGP